MSNNPTEFDEQATEGQSTLPIILRDYLPYWPVIVAAVLLGYLTSTVYLRYTKPTYAIASTVMIKNDDKSADNLIKQAMGEGKSSTDDEVEIIKGRRVLEKAVELANYFYEIRLYGKINHSVLSTNQSPVQLIFLKPDSIKPFEVKFNVASDGKNLVVNGKQRYPMGQLINLQGNPMVIKRNESVGVESLTANGTLECRLLVFSKEQRTNALRKNFTAITSKKNSLVVMGLKSDWEEGGVRLLRAIIDAYTLESQDEKRRMSEFTMDFIDSRLAYLGDDLDSIEKELEVFKSTNSLEVLSTETQRILNKVQLGDQKAVELDLQLMVLEDLEKYVLGKIKNPTMAPYSAGLTQVELNAYFSDLIKMEKEFQVLKETNGPKSDVVLIARRQIETTKNLLLETVRNTYESVKLLKQRADRDFNRSTSAYGNLIKVIPSKERQLINITRQQEIKSALFTYLLERREEAAISAAGKLSDLRIVEFPRSNGVVSPKAASVYGISILGLVSLVIGILFVKSALNNKITAKSDIEERTTMPVLGEIMQAETDSPLVMKEGNRSLIAEQFRGLRTSLGYMGDGSGKNKILVSSSIPGEGKSFVSTNIAISYALTGQKTVLIESDLRKPNIAKHFSISKRIGLSTYLNGNSTLEEIVIPTHIENLYVIAAGPIPPNPVELMMNGKYQHLIEQLGELYDHVVIDCPPIGLVTDAEILGKWVDACVFIVRHQYTPKQAISNLLDRLYKGEKFNRMAIVMNGLKGGISGYGYGYGYGYGNGYGYGYGYGNYGGYGYGYYGNEQKPKRVWWKEVYKVVVIPFFAFLGIKSKVR